MTLTELRESKQWTQKQLADRLNVDKSTISNYEAGRRRPDYDTMYRIAEVFDISVAQAHSLFLRQGLRKESTKGLRNETTT